MQYLSQIKICRSDCFQSYCDEDNYYFDKTLVHKKVIELCRSQNEDFAVSEKALCDALKNERLSICDEGSALRKVRVGKSTKRWLCIPRKVFTEPAESEDDDLPFGPDHSIQTAMTDGFLLSESNIVNN